ncbi:glycosyltransferase [Parashewanella spongiae]|uniref:Glycosyltransferase n=1 Tax=Parashewanella spongiae TaxID=342950 RepID=A0A3A6TZM4_9GAMM|nr:MJ1255/VC2487 family glycosyltransferase [Parashewanella spongiae]MCL1079728.1 glycosyltransferase [Parashewanella spongiae]RJY07106.1 glycosyltransferase [Parashewanella spongiae]
MRILYGVQGTGNGHLSRARVMAEALKKTDIHVDYLFSGRNANDFFDMEAFGNYQVMRGLTFVSRAGKINIPRTIMENLSTSIFKDISALDVSDYDLVLNDFEPVTAWAARKQGIPSFGVSHQASLNYPVPKTGNNWFNESLLKYFAPVDNALGCHWHHFGFPILPPFVDVKHQDVEFAHQIVVYLPFEAPEDIVDYLSPYQNYQFLVYHSGEAPRTVPEHIIWSGFDREGFKQNLAQCGGVMCNAGFELVSEALTLGKKILVKPLLGQFEQLSNVAALELLAAATSMMTLDNLVLERWLKAPSPEPIHYPEVADSLVEWLQKGDWEQQEQLCNQLWDQVKLPDSWKK